MEKELKLNLSGHFNQALADMGYSFPGTLHVDAKQSCETTVSKLTDMLVGMGVGSGTVLHLAVPGMSALATQMLVAIHGLTGVFPFVAFLTRNEDGTFGVSEVCDMQAMRNNVSRTKRDIISL